MFLHGLTSTSLPNPFSHHVPPGFLDSSHSDLIFIPWPHHTVYHQRAHAVPFAWNDLPLYSLITTHLSGTSSSFRFMFLGKAHLELHDYSKPPLISLGRTQHSCGVPFICVVIWLMLVPIPTWWDYKSHEGWDLVCFHSALEVTAQCLGPGECFTITCEMKERMNGICCSLVMEDI